MTGLLEPTIKETYQGRAEVLNSSASRRSAPSPAAACSDGLIKRDSEVRLLRDDEQVFKGKIGSLALQGRCQRSPHGMECGIDLANYSDIKVGDVIEAFTTEKLAAELGQNSAAARKAEKAEKEREAAAAAAAATAENSVNA